MRTAVVAALLAAGLAVQWHFFRAYPQPVLFGDPAGYYKVGERFQEAWTRLRAGEDAGEVFDSVRGVLYLSGVGLLFAVLDGLRPEDWGFFQRVLGLFNSAAMLGSFLLARRLSGRFGGGVAALVLCVVYPTFSVQTGRLYPDPVTGCLFVWSAWLYLEALHRGSGRWMAGAAFLFTIALLVRAQLMTYMLMVIGLLLALTMRRWIQRPPARRLVLAFLLACLPAAAAWVLIVRAVGDRDDVAQLGNVTFKPLYPYGFWQSLETDGWVGPYRFKTEPYYQAMAAQGKQDPRLMRSRARQWLFTAGYVAERPRESALLVLDNAYRLYDRPANDYKWDYPLPYPWQVALQRALVVLALAGMALFVAERAATAGVLLLPLSLAVLHGLVFPWPRYNVPTMPILLAAAGAAVVRLAGVAAAAWRSRDEPAALPGRRWRRLLPLLALSVGMAVLIGAHLLFMPLPGAARLLHWLGWLALLAVPFLLAARAMERRRLLALLGLLAVAIPFTAHALRDRLWHQVLTPIGPGREAMGVEQEIVLGPEAMGSLRAASEAFLVLDLRVPQGDLSRTELQVGGQTMPGSSLVPTMPRLRESTSTGGRDWRGYPQWWALPLDAAWLPPPGQPLRVRLLHRGSSALLLGADRFGAQQRVYEGPSFGDWPRLVALKLEYDGDYRIPVTAPLASLGTRSYLLDARGGRRPFAAAHRIRLVTLRNDEGWLDWRSAPLPPAPRAALVFSAWSGHRGRARLTAGQAPPLDLPLGARTRFSVQAGALTLCHQAEGERGEKAYGSYVLTAGERLGPPGAPVDLRLRFRTGMNDQPMFFVVDRNRPLAETASALGDCLPPATALVSGAAQVVDATHNNYPEDTGRWAVDRVF